MQVFVTAVEAGNFRAASETLDISSVMVGKHIRQLETLLGTRLLQRSTRRQSLTEAGAAFYRSTLAVLEQVRIAEQSIEHMQATPRGLLRISAPTTLGACAVAPLIPGYLARFPEVRAELVLSNARVDLIEEGFDLAIRVGELDDNGLVARPLRPYRMAIAASPTYLAAAGTPQCWDDLAHHHCLNYQVWNGRNAWFLDGKPEHAWPTQTRLASNDGHALRYAAIHDAGLVLQPEVLLVDDIAAGTLVPVLQAHWPPVRPVHLVYLPDRRPRPKLDSFIRYLLQALA